MGEIIFLQGRKLNSSDGDQEMLTGALEAVKRGS